MSAQLAQALQHALMAASREPMQRATAVTALRGAEMWAATWPTDPATLRTLTNSNGVTALAVFTDERQLEDAALRYAWLGVDGRVPSKKLHMSEAIRFARQNRAQLVVVDIAADHALELDEGEMELVSAPPSARPPSFTGLQTVKSQSSRPPALAPSEVKRVSVRPDTASSSRPPRSASQGSLRPVAITTTEKSSVAATFGGPTTSTMRALSGSPDDALLAGLAGVLKGYPEVEWASFLRSGSGDENAVPSVALRMAGGFLKNLEEISRKLREAGLSHSTAVEVLVLDTPEQMKQARAMGQPFFPWRKGKR